MLKVGKVVRGRKCAEPGCEMKVEPGKCVEAHVGSGKWKRVHSYCRTHGTMALNEARTRLHDIETAVYGSGGA